MPRRRTHQLTPEEIDAVRAIALARSTAGRLHFAAAMEELPAHPACTPETADWVRSRIRHYRARGKKVEWPQSVRRACRITPDVSARFRGDKAARMAAPHITRGGFWRDEKGRERALEPHSIYESDDVSLNEPFRWRDPDTGRMQAGRQCLASVDVGSGGFLALQLVGRPKDAYRQEDIADHFLHTCELHGLPEAWRLEHGSWAATFVRGIEVEGMERRWGGLDALFGLVFTDGPRAKGFIESRFHMLQSRMAHTEGGVTIGRQRGEFERAAKLMRRVGYDRRRAEADPSLGSDDSEAAVSRLWPMEQAADAALAAADALNRRPMERAWSPAPIVPAEALQSHRNDRAIPQQQRWRFHPVKRQATVRRGQVEIKLPGWSMPFRFAVNGACGDLYLEDGYKVLVAFHPGRPEEGCAIANRESGVRNYRAYGLGDIIHHALPYQPLQPQIDLSTPSGTAGNGMSRAVTTATRREFRGIAGQMEEYRRHRAKVARERDAATPARANAKSDTRDSAGNRAEHAGTAAPLPDLHRLRAATPPAEETGAAESGDPIEAFRSGSLFTDEEREHLRYG